MGKKLIILGGTGLLGYHTALLALKKDYEVTSLSIDDINLEGWYPKEIKVIYMDVFKASEEELTKVMEGYDYMVYSIGPDDRVTPPAPSYTFFHERLVNHCGKAFRAAEKAGIKKSIVFNSYFAYFDRRDPEVHYAEKHPYIKCRVEQAELLLKQRKNMEVVILELPYIFGAMPERLPLWKEVFLDRFVNGYKIIFFPKGSTTMTTVDHIAEAAIGAIEYGKDGERYPIGDENHSYDFMLNEMTSTILGKPRKIIHPGKNLCAMGAAMIAKKEAKQGHETGLNFKLVMKEIMSKDVVIEESVMDKVNAELHISRGGLKEAIHKTMRRCYPNPKDFK